MGNISIASTQKAGEGDAFILDNAGATRNIGILSRMKLAEDKRNQQERIAKDKKEADVQKQFFDSLSGINTLGIRPKDVGFLNTQIDDLLKNVNDAKMAGKNPLDMNNVSEYTNTIGQLGKIQAYAHASRSMNTEDLDFQKKLMTDTKGLYDKDKSMKAFQTRYDLDLPEALSLKIEPVQAPIKFGEILDKTLGDNIKEQLKVAKEYKDRGEVDKANEIVAKIKQGTLTTALRLGDPYVNEGRISVDDIVKQSNAFIEQYNSEALYDPNKDEDQSLAKDKFDLDFWKKHQDASQGWKKIDIAKKAAAKLDTNLEKMFVDMANGQISSTMFQGKPNLETAAVDESGEVVTENGKPVPSAYGKVLQAKQKDSNGQKGFTVEIVNPLTNTVQGTKFIPVLDKEGKSIVTTTSAYQNLQDIAVKNGYRYVGNTGYQAKTGVTENTQQTASKNVGKLAGLQKQNTAPAAQTITNNTGGTWTDATSSTPSKQKPYYVILDPKTGKGMGIVSSEEDAKKAQAKGYNITKSDK
jgi:hypothetical protein